MSKNLYLVLVVSCLLISSIVGYGEDEDLPFNGFRYGYADERIVTFNTGKVRIENACLPEDGVCTQFTLCTLESIKHHPNGVTIAGHDNFLCPNINDVCCTPDKEAVEKNRLRAMTLQEKNDVDKRKIN